MRPRRPRRCRAAAAGLVAAMVFAVACSDAGPVSGPGVLTATLMGPNGAEGAALITLLGDGVGAVSPVAPTSVHVADGASSTTRILLINQEGGELRVQVEVADTTQPPTAVVEQVAGPDDALRLSLDGYSVAFRR